MVTRRPIIQCNNDLTQYFDRILCHLAQINNQSYGLPLSIATILSKYLQEATYCIKTGIGLSKRHYSHSNNHGVFGTGQGSVKSIYAWGMTVSCLIDLHIKLGHDARYNDPTGKLKPLIVGMLLFVDNCNQSITGEKHEDIRDLLGRSQHNMKLWNDLVRASGAKLELSKCFTQIIHFDFGINGAPVVDQLKDNLHLELIDRINNRPVRINPISSYTTYKSLGKLQCVSENQVTQLKHLRKKAVAHTRALVSTKVTYSQAWLHHVLCYIPSVSYPLAVCHLSESQLNLL